MEIPYETTPRRDTGLFNSKLGVWLFLASEVMLFGGLFSAYVFLRVGVRDGFDVPWPWGVNVHKTFIFIGFVNTIVLIVSSVFVVFGWVALKERKWRKFQLYTYATVLCAVIFMMFKGVEYRSKLTQHHDIRLKDGSLMEGKILDKSYNVPFKATSVDFQLAGAAPGFLYDVKGDFPALTAKWREYGVKTDADGKPVLDENNKPIRELQDKEAVLKSKAEFDRWFVRARTTKKKELTAERKRYRNEIAAERKALFAKEPATTPQPPKVDGSATVSVAEGAPPIEIFARHRRVGPIARGDKEDTLTYKDGCTLRGKGGDDTIKFEPHYVDMQMVPLHLQEESMVWDVLGDDHAKKMWFKNRKKAYEEMEEYFAKKDRDIPESQLRGYFINIQSLHDKDHEPGFWQKFIKEFKAGAGFGQKKEKKDITKAAAAGKGEAHGGEGDHENHYSVISVKREDTTFFHSHGPRNNNYYAIYFTITALHGLHVIGGALVLLYFAVFGRKIYRKNPEHLANRVEVGGLFWHFVDLVWIFLFPLMYLL